MTRLLFCDFGSIKVMLCFSRDTEINQIINQDVVNNSKTKQYDGPPSVVPFHGICMFGK